MTPNAASDVPSREASGKTLGHLEHCKNNTKLWDLFFCKIFAKLEGKKRQQKFRKKYFCMFFALVGKKIVHDLLFQNAT